ncbi:hypothetical protein HWV62_45561 [Athelia sp. TMB]|nr:hypothetical protein HWV62_45561 [Athelia sp. TMB]
MDAIRERSISHIEKAIPRLQPVDIIELATKYDIPSWLTPAYVAICQRSEPIEEWEAMKLGLSAAIKLARAREMVRATSRPSMNFGGSSGFGVPPASGNASFGLTVTSPFIPPKPEVPFSPQTVLKIVNEVFGTA